MLDRMVCIKWVLIEPYPFTGQARARKRLISRKRQYVAVGALWLST